MADAEQRMAAEITRVKTLVAPPEGIFILSAPQHRAWTKKWKEHI